jgi:hypothetical protein
MKEDRMRRLAILLAVVAAVGASFYLGYERFHGFNIFGGKLITVQISQKAGGPDCIVDTGNLAHPKDAYVHLPAFLRNPDHIRWCIANSVSTPYFIYFPVNPTTHDTPLDLSEFPVNKNPDPPNTCSDPRLPVGKRGVHYDYEVRYATSSGTACTDPKVILK